MIALGIPGSARAEEAEDREESIELKALAPSAIGHTATTERRKLLEVGISEKDRCPGLAPSDTQELKADVHSDTAGEEIIVTSPGLGALVLDQRHQILARWPPSESDCRCCDLLGFGAVQILPDSELELVIIDEMSGHVVLDARHGSTSFQLRALTILKRRGGALVRIFKGLLIDDDGKRHTVGTIERVGSDLHFRPSPKRRPEVWRWSPEAFKFEKVASPARRPAKKR